MWENEVKAIKDALKEGYRVQTPLGEFMLGIRKSIGRRRNPDQFDVSGLHLIFHAERIADGRTIRRDTEIQVLHPNSFRSRRAHES